MKDWQPTSTQGTSPVGGRLFVFCSGTGTKLRQYRFETDRRNLNDQIS